MGHLPLARRQAHQQLAFSVRLTAEGVSTEPRLFGISSARPPFQTPTALLVVPRSIPMIIGCSLSWEIANLTLGPNRQYPNLIALRDKAIQRDITRDAE